MSIDSAFQSVGFLDRLSYGEGWMQSVDSRAKVVVTALFMVTVVSFPKYAVVELAPLFIFPFVIAALGDIPLGYLAGKVLLVSPFVLFVGILNPLFDRTEFILFSMNISGGWVSFASILVKACLTVAAAFLLVATTSFPGVCHALRRLGFPALFVSLLLLTYRYLFVLMEEGMRILRARDQRSFGRRGKEIRIVARILGAFFLRTVDRGERIYEAMLARGFSGDVPTLRTTRLRPADLLFMLVAAAALIFLRLVPVTEILGGFAGVAAR